MQIAVEPTVTFFAFCDHNAYGGEKSQNSMKEMSHDSMKSLGPVTIIIT